MRINNPNWANRPAKGDPGLCQALPTGERSPRTGCPRAAWGDRSCPQLAQSSSLGLGRSVLGRIFKQSCPCSSRDRCAARALRTGVNRLGVGRGGPRRSTEPSSCCREISFRSRMSPESGAWSFCCSIRTVRSCITP